MHALHSFARRHFLIRVKALIASLRESGCLCGVLDALLVADCSLHRVVNFETAKADAACLRRLCEEVFLLICFCFY